MGDQASLGEEDLPASRALILELLVVDCGDVVLQVAVVVEPLVADVALSQLLSVHPHVLREKRTPSRANHNP